MSGNWLKIEQHDHHTTKSEGELWLLFMCQKYFEKKIGITMWQTFNYIMLTSSYMGRSPNYGRNSNILIPDPYH
jgi:hypothetical protein